MSLHFTYTRGAAGGAFDWQLEVSHYSVVGIVPAGASEWVTMSLYAAGVVAAGGDTTSLIQRELISYEATGAGAEDFVFVVALDGLIERVRIRARESGAVGTPGTLQITAVLI
jgi:hypothetical protein